MKNKRALALSGRFASSSPKGRASGETGNFAWTAKASPFEERLPPLRGKMSRSDKRGSVDLRSKDGEGEDANRSAALSQKAALQMPFPSTTPPVKRRLEHSAERDKRETINNNTLIYGQSPSGGHFKS